MKARKKDLEKKESMYGRCIIIRVSDDDFKKIEQLSMESGLNSRTKFIKKCILGSTISDKKSDKKLREQWKEFELLLRKIEINTLLRDNTNV